MADYVASYESAAVARRAEHALYGVNKLMTRQGTREERYECGCRRGLMAFNTTEWYLPKTHSIAFKSRTPKLDADDDEDDS